MKKSPLQVRVPKSRNLECHLLSFTTLKCYRSFLKIRAKESKQLPSFLYVCLYLTLKGNSMLEHARTSSGN